MNIQTSDVARIRLQNQRIIGKKFTKATDVVRWMGAMQAQDYGQATWAIATRMQNGTLLDVEKAIADGEILRTWPMRGTIHFVPSEDAKWMLRLLTTRTLAGDKRRREMLELNESIYATCQKLLENALAGRKLLSRPKVMELFEANGVTTSGQRGYHILWYLAQTGIICIGPMEGKQQTFALLDEWARTSRDLSRDESLAELAIRYATSHGPVTAQDFAGWSNLPVSDVKRALDLAGSRLTACTIEGIQYWLGKDAATPPKNAGGVHLLPGFDEYLLGYKGRSAQLDLEHASKVVPGSNGVFLPMLVIDGKICGTWKRTVKKSNVDILVLPFTKVAQSTAAITDEAQRYAAYLGLDMTLTIA